MLVAGLSVSGWLYLTGRLGFGPLSEADKDAATTIAAQVEGPEWADERQRMCAADDLVAERRSGALEDAGVIERDEAADHGWTYTGTWPLDDATTYLEGVLDCARDWEEQVGEVWKLDDTSCLADIGSDAVAAYFVADVLEVDEDDQDQATADQQATVEQLDECYATDLSAPEARTTPGYRSVRFDFELPEAANADVVVTVDDGQGGPRELTDPRLVVDTAAGGREACVKASAEATYAWGTTRTSEKKVCDSAKPPRLWWVELPRCTGTAPCTSWDLRYEGFESNTPVTVTLYQNGGDCQSQSGQCSFTFRSDGEGRGTPVTWSAPPNWSEHFEARAGKLRAVLPN